MVDTASSASRQSGLWISTGFLLLGICGLILASTIILSLIPLYLSTKTVDTQSTTSATLTKSYSISGAALNNISGSNTMSPSALSYVQNDFQSKLNQNAKTTGSKINVLSGTLNQISSGGRKRQSSSSSIYQVTITFTITYALRCSTQECRNNIIALTLNDILQAFDLDLSIFAQFFPSSFTTTITTIASTVANSATTATTTVVLPSGASASASAAAGTTASGRRKRRSLRDEIHSSKVNSFMPVAGCLLIGDKDKVDDITKQLYEDHPFIKLLPRGVETMQSMNGKEIDLYGFLRENKLSKSTYNELIQQDNIVNGHFLTLGAIGCLEAHVRAWTRVLEINQPMLILEHDVKFEKELFDALLPYILYSLPTNFSLLYFGNLVGESMTPSLKDYNDLLWKVDGANWGTYTYLISPLGAATLLDLIYPISAQVDSMIINIANSQALQVFMSKQILVRTDNSFGRTSQTQRYVVQPIMIPRIFHFIWLSNDGLSAAAEKNINLWAKLHPDWQIKVWTNDSIAKANITSYNKDRLEHSARSLRQVSDIIRYDIIYQYGGIYADVDFEPLKNIESILHGVQAFVVHENEMFVCNGMFGAIPGHELTERLITQLEANWKNTEDGTVNQQTGPYHMTNQVQALLKENAGIRKDGFQIFAPHVFFPYAWYEKDPGHPYDEHSFAVHHFRSYAEIERNAIERT